MKSFLKCTALAAVAAVALVSCKQETYAPEQPGDVHITVKAVPQDFANEGTRTYIDNTNTILWGTGEYMKIAIEGGSTVWGNSTDASADLFDGEPEALFEFNLSPDAADNYTYMGLYPASAAVASNNGNAANYKVKLPSIQNATAASYDPAAYIMVAKPEMFDAVETEWEASFRRATALNKVTLTNLNDDIIQVDFIAGEGVNLAGSAHIDLTTGEDVDIYAGENAVTVKYATALPASANKVVWFTSWDTEIAEGEKLTIVAKSATKSYTRELTARSAGILLKEGYLNTLSVNMTSATVQDLTSLEGNYVILAKKDVNTYYAMKGEASGTRIASVDYDGSLESYNGSDDLIWTITEEGSSYTIKNGGNYLGWTSGNSADLIAEADYNANKCLMSIDDNGDGTYKIYVTAETTRILARNTSNAYFAFYGNTQYKDLVLVPAVVDTRAEVTLSFEEPEIVLDLDNYVDFEGQYATAYSNGEEVTGLNITYSWDIPEEDSDFGGIDPDGSLFLGGEVDVTATVTATFAGNDTYKPATATYTIVIHDNSTPPAQEGYALINSINDVTDGLYVIAAKVGDTYIALKNDFSGTGRYNGASVTVTNSVISSSDANDFYLTFTKNVNNEFTITGQHGTLGYNTSTSFASNATGEKALWTISIKNIRGTFRITNVNATTRGVIYSEDNGANVFGAYATSNVDGSKPYYDVELFKYNGTAPVIKTNPTTTVTPASPINLEVGTTQQLTANTDSDGAVSYESSDENVATVSAQGLITAVAAGSATITVKTAETEDFNAGSTQITVNVTVPAVSSTIADVFAGGAGTYEVPNVTVYAVKGNALILGDETAKIYAYKSNHGLSVGDVRTVSGTTKVYNEVYEFDAPTFTGTGTTTVDHGTAVEIDLVASTLQSSFTSADNKYTAVYAHVIGTQSGRSITTDGGTALYLSANENDTNGKTVEAYGYVYAYSTTHSNFDFLVTSIEEYVDPNAPALSITPTSASWASGENDTKTFEVTAANGTWAISSNGVSSWATVEANTTNNTITVTPNTAQAGQNNSGDITVTLTPTGAGYSVLTATISLSQAMYNAGGTESVVYTLTPASGSNNAYANNCDITINGITWNLTGNSTFQPWRIGGKSLSETDRALYSKTALNYDISKIEITHGNASGITVNSMTVIVASDAAFNNVISTLTPTFAANNTVTINRPSGVEWKNCYYKIVYNVTVTVGSNKFIEFTEAKFTGK